MLITRIFLSRRFRSICLKYSVLIIFLILTFILWSKVLYLWIDYQKIITFPQFNIEIGGSGSYLRFKGLGSNNIQDLRKKVLEENYDEFLAPVLKELTYSEVDLASKKKDHFEKLDEEIEKDLGKVVPGLGEGGELATVPLNKQNISEEVIKIEAFNRILSEMISLNRSTPETRLPSCLHETYPSTLPHVSVVIIFTNEAFTALVRTVHSIVSRTPGKLLKEIILVDDYSGHKDLKGKLERYIATKFELGKIRLIRLNQRSGLVKARMIGAHLAIGDVLFFLDAHCEVSQGWAEPLLTRIKENRKALVCPVINTIDYKTMEYSHNNGEYFQIGGFNWNGDFTWINISKSESYRKKRHYSSPTMSGGIFAIDRKYFWEMGSYDSGMELWGGENLEMSFRIWMCGGSVEVLPCSRVGHIFRPFMPYTFPNNLNSFGLNTVRLVEVWMDDYKELFYSYKEELQSFNYGNVSNRIAFRNRMKCKSFKWYLDNVYKEKFQMKFDSQLYGQVKNKDSNFCLDNMQHEESEEFELSLFPCNAKLSLSQKFMLSNKGELRRENTCASVGRKGKVSMILCERRRPNDLWEYRKNSEQLYNSQSGKCLTVDSQGVNKILIVTKCKKESFENQRWIFDPSIEEHVESSGD